MTRAPTRRLRGARRAVTRRPDLARVRRRSLLVLAVYGLAFAGIATRLVFVQVVHAEDYAAIGQAQRARTVELPARRGRLYDRNGSVLATSVAAATIYADPRAYRPETRRDGLVVPPAASAAEVAAALAPLLGRDPGELRARMEQDAHFVYLARTVDRRVGEQVAALDLPGVGVLEEPKRVYPAGGLAAQVLGFTGLDGYGLTGLELAHNQALEGRAGHLLVERAPGGVSIPSGLRELRPPEPGTDLVLTLDRDIQAVAEQSLTAAVEQFDARGASAVVLEIGTGEVLAMASVPGYDPNHVGRSGAAQWRNRAATDVFEPGSVQKAVTAAAALEEGVVTPGTRFVVEDRVVEGSRTFSDAHRHEPEEMTFQQIIETSSNVGTILVARALGPERLAAYLERFGYGRATGIGYPGEAAGILPPVEGWWATSLPTIAIGQGVAATLLQLAHVYATIADDGVATRPRLVRGTVGPDGQARPLPQPARQRVISSTTAVTVRDILGSVVVGDRGTGRRAAVAGYEVAGKTGTARKPLPDARGYSDQYVAVFVGFAPLDDPRLVVAVMVDEPWPIWGGVVAAPVFAEVMGFALAHLRVPATGPAIPLESALDQAALQEAELRAARREAELRASRREAGPAPTAQDGAPPAPAG